MIRQIFIFFRQQQLYNRLQFKLQLWRYYFRRLLGRTCGRPIQIPLFEITSCPTIPLAEVRERRFNLIDRAQNMAMQEAASLSSITDIGNTTTKFVYARVHVSTVKTIV